MNVFKSKRLEIISFITGFCLLSYELAAARILAPTIGSSTYVWTSVIGVIIAALSLGFIVGGKLADARKAHSDVVWLLVLASTAVILTTLSYPSVLENIASSDMDQRIKAVLAALILFAPTSFLIGMTSPYLAKLKMKSLSSTGRVVASLDSFNALGGIVGTFMTGFILFGYVGARQTIMAVAALLLFASWLVIYRYRISLRLVITALMLIVLLIPGSSSWAVASIDTPSAHYEVVSGYYGNRVITGLTTGPDGIQSAVYKNGSSDLVFWYANEMARLTVSEKPKSVLLLGGGAFTIPQYLSEVLPDAYIDVVEIDPELKGISETYFNYTNPKNVTPIFEDARTYLNKTNKMYDVILVDAYGDGNIPFNMMTKEYGRSVSSRLAPGGLLIANIIGGQTGKCLETLNAVDASYRSYLPNVLYKNQSGEVEVRANYIVAYSVQPRVISGYGTFTNDSTVSYTDNYAPSERLYYDCRQSDARL